MANMVTFYSDYKEVIYEIIVENTLVTQPLGKEDLHAQSSDVLIAQESLNVS